MSPRLWALTVALCAVCGGFAAGAVVIGPMFSDEALTDAAATQRAERFSSRTVDLTRNYPDPFVYRTPTPAFPDQGPTGVAEAARNRALASVDTDRRTDRRDVHSQGSPFDAFALSAHAPSRAAEFDRHTGVTY